MKSFMTKPIARRGSFLARLIVANTVVFVSSLLLISAVNYVYTTTSTEKQISETYKKWLSQTDYNISTLYERSFQIGEQLLNDKDIIKGLYSNALDPADSMTISQKLRDAIIVNDFIHSVYLYNGQTGKFFHTISQDVDISTIDPDARALIDVRKNAHKMVFLPHKQVYAYDNKNYENHLLSLIFTLSDAKTEYAIFINLKLNAVQDLFNKMGNSAYSNFMIVDKNGVNIIHGERPGWFMSDISGQPFIDKVIHSTDTNNNFIETVDENKSLVTYVYNDKLGWYLINTTRYDYLTRDSFILQRNIITVSLLVLLVSIVATVLMNRKVYGPFASVVKMIRGTDNVNPPAAGGNEVEYISGVFKGLIGKVTSLEDSASKDRRKLKESFIKDALNDGAAVEEEKLPSAFERYGIALNPANMRVIAFTMVGVSESAPVQPDTGIAFVKDAMAELAVRVFQENLEKADTGNDSFAILMNNRAGLMIEYKTSEFVNKVESMMNISLLAGIGIGVSSFANLSRSYETAKEALSYHYLLNEERVFDYEAIQSRIDKSYRYSAKRESVLFDAIRLNDTAACHRIIEGWFGELQHCSMSDVQNTQHQLLYRIETEFRGAADFAEFLAELGTQSLAEAIAQIRAFRQAEQFYMRLAEYIVNRLKKDRYRDSNGIVKNACDYIQMNYMNGDLSADSVAAALHISVPYFSKLFNEHMKITFTNYVTGLRIQEAEELLLNTPFSVKEIGETVGFLNSSYFITVFKKKHGVSPNQFRQTKKAESCECT